MAAEGWRAVVVADGTEVDRLVHAITTTDVVIVVDDSMSPIRLLTGLHVLEQIQKRSELTAEEGWWGEHGAAQGREELHQQNGPAIHRVQFELGLVEHTGWKYTLQAADTGPFAAQLAGEQARACLYLECDRYQHPNFVTDYEVGMLCEDEHPWVHKIREGE